MSASVSFSITSVQKEKLMIVNLFWKKRTASSSLTAAAAKSRFDAGALGIDVRETSEWKSGHIGGSRHIPLGTLTDVLSSIPRDRDVVLICTSGHRSSRACDLLERNGFVNVYNLAGGVSAWQSPGLPFVR
jgi:rhodanese-related sulfurtransferase